MDASDDVASVVGSFLMRGEPLLGVSLPGMVGGSAIGEKAWTPPPAAERATALALKLNAAGASVEALVAAFGGSASSGRCGLGSVKSNIGHLEPAAGIAGASRR